MPIGAQSAKKIMASFNRYYVVLPGIKRPELHTKAIKSTFSNIFMLYKCQNEYIHDLADYFLSNVKFSLTPDFRDLLTFGDLINIIIYMYRPSLSQ